MELKCTYCGSETEIHRDHVVPVSFTHTKRTYRNCELVPACKECNSLLGAKFLVTVPSRAAYLLAKYEQRYKKLLKAPRAGSWHFKDDDDIGPNLKSAVAAMDLEAAIVRQKLTHLNLVASRDD